MINCFRKGRWASFESRIFAMFRHSIICVSKSNEWFIFIQSIHDVEWKTKSWFILSGKVLMWSAILNGYLWTTIMWNLIEWFFCFWSVNMILTVSERLMVVIRITNRRKRLLNVHVTFMTSGQESWTVWNVCKITFTLQKRTNNCKILQRSLLQWGIFMRSWQNNIHIRNLCELFQRF